MILSVTLRSLYTHWSRTCVRPDYQRSQCHIRTCGKTARPTLQHTRPCYAKSRYRSVDPQTLHGNVHQVDHVPNGPTNSAAITTMFPLRLCGGKPICQQSYLHLLPSPTHFHSRLKTLLFCKSFSPQPFTFLLRDLWIPKTVYCYF